MEAKWSQNKSEKLAITQKILRFRWLDFKRQPISTGGVNLKKFTHKNMEDKRGMITPPQSQYPNTLN